MERFCAYPSRLPSISSLSSSPISSSSSSPSSSSSASSSSSGGAVTHSSAVSTVIGRILSVVLTFCFAAVGSFIGAMTGAFLGQATESGFFRGAGIGAISGAVFSIEVFESSRNLWRSNESGFWSVLYVIDVLANLLSGRLVREQVGPVMLSAVQSQMSSVVRTSEEEEDLDIFSTGGTKGLSGESVQRLPKTTITTKNIEDDYGEKISCSVCLQDLQVGETVRCLPHCKHIFHLPCIDNWLVRHGSCPLCRRDLWTDPPSLHEMQVM